MKVVVRDDPASGNLSPDYRTLFCHIFFLMYLLSIDYLCGVLSRIWLRHQLDYARMTPNLMQEMTWL